MCKLLKRLTVVRSWSAASRCWFPAGRFVPPPGCAEPSRWAGTLLCALRVSAAKTTEALTARSLSLCLSVSLPHPLSLLPSFSNSHVLFLPLLLLHRFSSFSASPLTFTLGCFLPRCWRSLFLLSNCIWFKCSLLTLSKSIQRVLTTGLPLMPALIPYIIWSMEEHKRTLKHKITI